jgi:twitching motility two-component system response regulator PilG
MSDVTSHQMPPSMMNREISQTSRPIVLLSQFASSFASGHFRVTQASVSWSIYLDGGSLTYASNSVDPFDRLELHLRRLSQRVPSLISETRAHLRAMFEPGDTSPLERNADYRAICWLVDQRILSSVEAAELVEGLLKEVLESFLLLPEGRCEFFESQNTLPWYCRMALPPLVDYCRRRIQAWQALAPHIWSPYQRPYLFSQNQAQHRLSPEQQRKLASILRGYSFRQLAALMNQDELKVAKNILSYITAGTVLLREPRPPFDQLPRIPARSPETTSVQEAAVATVAPPAPATYPEATPTMLQESPVATSDSVATHTIACIDDSPTILSEMKRFLNDETFRVHAISDPLKALIQVIRLKPDLILLDIGMPNIDGYKLCRLLRNHSLFSDTPIVMVTGNTGIIDRAKAKFAGASDYLTKPFTKSELLEVVFRHLT